MHDHSHGDNKSDSGMMWLMMLCCLAPLLYLWLTGRGIRVPTWGIVAGVVIFLAVHMLHRRRSSTLPPPSTSAGHPSHPDDHPRPPDTA